MLPEPKYVVTRTRNTENLYTLEDEYSILMVGVSLTTIFNEIRDREEEEGFKQSDVEELEF